MVKKNIVIALCIACLLPVFVCTSFANEGYAVHPRQSLPEMIISLLGGDSSIALLDCNPSSGSVEYVSWVSYDYLSELSTTWDKAGVVVYNTTMNAYFIRVSFVPTISSSGAYEYCALGTTNGYVLGAKASDSSATLDSIYNTVMYMRLHVSTIMNRCNDFFIQLGSISDKLDTIATSVSNIVQTNSRLANLERITGNIYMQLIDDEESPLLLRLDAIKNAIENITISADNLTIEAYDDTALLNKLDSIITLCLSIAEKSIDSFDLFTAINDKLTSIKSSASSAASAAGGLLNLSRQALLPAVTNCSSRLNQLAASGNEVPSTLYDYVTMRLIPTQNDIVDYVTAIRSHTSFISDKVLALSSNSDQQVNYLSLLYDEILKVRATVGTGVQGQSVMTLLKLISETTHKVNTKLSSLSVTSSYDDTNVIAAVNAVESTLSNLSITSEVNTDLTPVIASIGAVGLNVEALNTYFNTDLNANLGSLVDKLDVVIEGSSESLENRINVVIDQENNAYNIFYVTGEDGETQSVTEFAGDLTEASGRLLSLLYRLVFADALSGVDGDLDAFENFYSDTGDSAAGTQSVMEGAVNVWQ